ncbi:MAG: prepilin-type N-terminal cleavage/methylation domain-containing protein [Candidatus Margulisiibacteriota bacterium]|nr:prepilin-type N-terminal cleavage/methylation domain-containing protein [Candidatus Margulisiibacteriota bacterium]
MKSKSLPAPRAEPRGEAGRQGFTLIELITVISLIAIITAVLTFFLWEAIDTWAFLSGQKGIAMSTQSAMYKVVRELKRVDGNSSISTFTSKEVTFTDINSNTITFSQEGTSLYRNSDILLDDLDASNGLIFSYLDTDGNPVASNEAIGVIRVDLMVVKGDNRFVIESAARVRTRRME